MKLTKKQQAVYDFFVPYIREEDEKEFARMLSFVNVTYVPGTVETDTLSALFLWSDTPQGNNYWSTLNSRIIECRRVNGENPPSF